MGSNNNNNKGIMPEVDGIYSSKVIDVNKHGVMVRINGFRKDFKGLLHNIDSPLVNSLIEGYLVKVRIVSCMQDGFVSVTMKDIQQPINNTNKNANKIIDEEYQKQKRKIRESSPKRSDIKQFTTPPTRVDIEVQIKEPDFLKNISTRIPAKIPTKIAVVKNENSFMAQVAREKNTNIQPAPFCYQQTSFNYEWSNPLQAKFSRMSIAPSKTKEAQFNFVQRSKMSMTEQRQSLPIYKYREDIIRAVTDNQFLIVEGETGSGKTTQITQYLIEAGFLLKGRIACTQPRRVAAISVAQRVAEEYGCMLGQEVGYKIRFEDVTSPSTIIKYMTDGILLRECLSNANLEQYSVIILDEAHERSIYTDVLFGILKEAAKRRPKMRIVISSATLDTQKFAKFFNNAKVMSIPGSMYPIDLKFRVNPERDYFNAAINTVLNIHTREPAGDILCFLTGQDEIDRAWEMVTERAAASSEFSNLYPVVLYSAMPFEDQVEIFTPIQRGQRKVIFSTNIAETSMTIDGVVYVVDCGYAKQKWFDPKTGMESLIVVPIAQSSANQRCGRAGRTAPGKCYRLYTENSYLNEMLDASVPDIQRSNMSNVILHLKAIGVIDILNFDFMDPPPRECLIAALKELYMLDALDEDGKITKIGRRMTQLPIDPNYAKMLIVSEDLKCTNEIITIIAMLSVPNIFYRPRKNQTLANEKKNLFNHAVGDHLRLVNVYNKWELNYTDPNWCKKHFLNEKKLYDAYEVRKHLLSVLDSRNIEIFSAGKNIERIQMAICAGFFKNIAYKDSQMILSRGTVKSYKTLDVHPETAYIHPSSSMFHVLPQWVVYNELRETNKKYLQDITVINPNWLPVIAKGMYRKTSSGENYSDELIRALVQAQSAREYKY